jgi:hypothetical protein
VYKQWTHPKLILLEELGGKDSARQSAVDSRRDGQFGRFHDDRVDGVKRGGVTVELGLEVFKWK